MSAMAAIIDGIVWDQGDNVQHWTALDRDDLLTIRDVMSDDPSALEALAADFCVTPDIIRHAAGLEPAWGAS